MNKVKLTKEKRSIAFLSLYYWTKCLGINPLSILERGDLETTRIGIFYNCFLCIIHCCVFYEVTKLRLEISLINEVSVSLVTDYVALLWQFLESLATWLISAFSQRRIILILKNFIKIERLSEKLETTNNYGIRSSEIVYYLAIVNFVYLTTIILSETIWGVWTNQNLAIWMIFYVHTLASFNATMLYILSLLIVKRKFHFLNEKLRDLVDNESRNCSRGSKRIASYDDDALVNEIVVISQLHRELRNVVYRVEKHIGVPVLLDIGNNFTYMTLVTYGFYEHLKSLEDWIKISNVLFMTAIAHWIVRPILMFLLISNVCGSTLQKANDTGNLLHAYLNNSKVHEKSPKYLMQLNIFSLELLNNHLEITICGLFQLDHLFIYSMIAASTSYLVIMLQFHL